MTREQINELSEGQLLDRFNFVDMFWYFDGLEEAVCIEFSGWIRSFRDNKHFVDLPMAEKALYLIDFMGYSNYGEASEEFQGYLSSLNGYHEVLIRRACLHALCSIKEIYFS